MPRNSGRAVARTSTAPGVRRERSRPVAGPDRPSGGPRSDHQRLRRGERDQIPRHASAMSSRCSIGDGQQAFVGGHASAVAERRSDSAVLATQEVVEAGPDRGRHRGGTSPSKSCRSGELTPAPPRPAAGPSTDVQRRLAQDLPRKTALALARGPDDQREVASPRSTLSAARQRRARRRARRTAPRTTHDGAEPDKSPGLDIAEALQAERAHRLEPAAPRGVVARRPDDDLPGSAYCWRRAARSPLADHHPLAISSASRSTKGSPVSRPTRMDKPPAMPGRPTSGHKLGGAERPLGVVGT